MNRQYQNYETRTKKQITFLNIVIALLGLILLQWSFSHIGYSKSEDLLLGDMRRSFVKVYVVSKVEDNLELVHSGGSGVLLENDLILTAGHVCWHTKDDKIKDFKPYVAVTQSDTLVYTTTVLILKKQDICILKANSPGVLTIPSKISHESTEPGNKVYSVSAPEDIYGPGLRHIFEGFYSGAISDLSMYTVPAAPGSSGGPVFNENGEVIGIIHSVHQDFNHIAFSTSAKTLVNLDLDVVRH